MLRICLVASASLFVAAGAATPAWSGPDPALAAKEAQLAGHASRRWILSSVVTFMDVGDHEKCSSGEVYTFDAHHQVDIAQCLNGRLQHTKASWTLTSTGPEDLLLTFGGHAYELLFRDQRGKHQLMLRDRDPGVAKPTHDRVLTLSDD